MGRKRIHQTAVRATIVLDQHTLDQIDGYADLRGITRSAAFREGWASLINRLPTSLARLVDRAQARVVRARKSEEVEK